MLASKCKQEKKSESSFFRCPYVGLQQQVCTRLKVCLPASEIQIRNRPFYFKLSKQASNQENNQPFKPVHCSFPVSQCLPEAIGHLTSQSLPGQQSARDAVYLAVTMPHAFKVLNYTLCLNCLTLHLTSRVLSSGTDSWSEFFHEHRQPLLAILKSRWSTTLQFQAFR